MNNRDLRRHSSIVVDGVEQAPSRSMLRAVGFNDEDFKKPQIEFARPGAWLHHATCISINWQSM